MATNISKSQQSQRAGIYTRISVAALGDTTKTSDQERICRELAARLGWEVAEVYCDHSKSAWQKNRKRPAWDQMLADVDAGRINAIVVYHGDRMVRRPEDLADLLRLADSKGVRLASPTGTYDLDKDRLELWIRAAFAEEESQRTSERRKSQYERWRREGRTRPGGAGGRAFGFETDGITLVPAEAAVIREAAARVIAGESASGVARDLAARGVLTPANNPMNRLALRKMLARPRLAGLMPDGIHPAAWEPVLDRETWEEVRAALEVKAGPYRAGSNARRWLLSGIAECGNCGARLQIRKDNNPQRVTGYRCWACRKVQRSQRNLDEYVITRVLAKLSDPGNPDAQVPRAPGLAAELGALTTQLVTVEAMIADHTKGDAELLMRRKHSIDGRLAELRELAGGNAGARLLGAHAGLTRKQFDDLPLATRRALVAACFTVTVLPASKRGPGFRTEDVLLARPDHDRS